VLAFGGILGFLVFQAVDQIAAYEVTRHGILTGFLPRAVLCVLLAGEVLAVVIGAVSLLLIRQRDKTSKAILGIVLRSLCGAVAGLCAGLFLWLFVGHVVIGF